MLSLEGGLLLQINTPGKGNNTYSKRSCRPVHPNGLKTNQGRITAVRQSYSRNITLLHQNLTLGSPTKKGIY